MPCSAAYLRTSSVMRIEQKCGPHMEQKCAVLAPSCGRVSSWNSRAVTGSRLRLNWSSHLNSNRALERALSRYCAPGRPLARPGALGEFALRFEFGELRYVIGVGDRTGAQAVADGKGNVVVGHDFADIVPVGVKETLLVMRQTPFGHDAAAAADDAGGTVCRQW